MTGQRFSSRWSVVAAAGAALLLSIASAVHVSVLAQAPGGAQRTVLDGVYTAAQAERGAEVYDAQCASCHEGADVDGPPLTGTPFIDRWREDTLENLHEFVSTQMPQRTPGSLPASTYLDLVAYLLHENEFPAGTQELTIERVRSTLLVGPGGPQPLPSGALVSVVGCVTQNPAREWTITRAAQPARVRVGNQITVAEAKTAAAAALGGQTFALQNVGDGGTALPAAGHKVLVKGALSQRAGAARVHVTAATSVAERCD